MQTSDMQTGPSDAGNKLSADENAACDVCGKSGAYKLGDGSLCLDCYHEGGSRGASESE